MKLSRQRLSLFFALLLSISLVIGLVPAVQAEEAFGDTVSILACSDFQNDDGNAAGRDTVNAILSAMKKDGITMADGFLCCGDYDYEYTDTRGGVSSLRTAVKKTLRRIRFSYKAITTLPSAPTDCVRAGTTILHMVNTAFLPSMKTIICGTTRTRIPSSTPRRI